MFLMVVCFVLLISLLLFIRSRKRQFVGELIYRVKTSEKVVALTFDDGPTPVYTEKVLEKLDIFGIKATFFLAGDAIEKNPELAKVIVNKGHQIGNHSYSHKKMVFVSYAFVKDEIEKTNQLILESGYKGDTTFRPPYGKKLFSLPMYLRDNSIPTIMWDVEPEKFVDTKLPQNIADYAIKNAKPGSIILLHPMFESRINTIESIPLIVAKLLEDGYKFVTVSELIQVGDNKFN